MSEVRVKEVMRPKERDRRDFKRAIIVSSTMISVTVSGSGPNYLLLLLHHPSRKQRKKMQSHRHQNQNQCVEQPNRMLANGPNHPGPCPEEIPMVDVSPNGSNTQQRQVQVNRRSDLTEVLEEKSPPDNPALHAEKEPTTDRLEIFSEAEINTYPLYFKNATKLTDQTAS